MTGMLVKRICSISILCGAALSICPEGMVKRILNVLCMAVLMLGVFSCIKETDFTVYALESAKLRERELELTEKSREISDRLNRLCIQQQCEAYIEDKAAQLNISVSGVKVQAKWSTEGLWVPHSAIILCDECDVQNERLVGIIEAELGIPAERQSWKKNE